jgi:hypothetical protein
MEHQASGAENMTDNLTPHEPGPDDDGFGGSLNSGRLTKGVNVRWNESQGWQDRDGITPPSPQLVVGIREVLQRWKDNKPEVIDAKPLPDPDDLNAAIPIKEWEIGLDGQPRKPWAHTVVVYLVNLGTGEFYTYAGSTIGGRIANDFLRESVITMRMLRGARVMPLVNLGERPMKTKFGMKTRPSFEIIAWKTPGDRFALPTEPPTLQLPNAAAPPPAAEPTPTPTQATSSAPQSLPPSKPQVKPRPAKPPVNLAADTLAAMGGVKPVTAKEFIDDDIPW